MAKIGTSVAYRHERAPRYCPTPARPRRSSGRSAGDLLAQPGGLQGSIGIRSRGDCADRGDGETRCQAVRQVPTSRRRRRQARRSATNAELLTTNPIGSICLSEHSTARADGHSFERIGTVSPHGIWLIDRLGGTGIGKAGSSPAATWTLLPRREPSTRSRRSKDRGDGTGTAVIDTALAEAARRSGIAAGAVAASVVGPGLRSPHHAGAIDGREHCGRDDCIE